MIRSGRLSFLFPIEKDSATWWSRYTARSCERKSCLSRRLPEWENNGNCISGSAGSGGRAGRKDFYLTAKTITRTVAEQAFSLLKEKGLLYKTITLTAKEKICFCEEAECNPDACPYAKGHFDRVNDAVFDLITHSGDWSREVLEEQAKKHMVCPFEMSLDVSNWQMR